MLTSAWSRKPPTSPAWIMLIISGGKTLGCLPRASDSAEPVSTSLRTFRIVSASRLFSVCSASTLSVRSSDSPAPIMVANWRDMIARSFSPTRCGQSDLPVAARSSTSRSRARGVKPMRFSRATAAASESASSDPDRMVPAPSMTS